MECSLLFSDICEKTPMVEHANETFNIESNIDGRYAVGTMLTITCDDTYIQSGHTNRTCQANGNWSFQAPVCTGKTRKFCIYYHPFSEASKGYIFTGICLFTGGACPLRGFAL